MNKGVLMFALNNEQIDYIELAVNAAKQVKKHLNLPVAIVTDSPDWLLNSHPDYRLYIDHVVAIFNDDIDQGVFDFNKTYIINERVFVNSVCWKKINDGIDFVLRTDYIEPIYNGITVDKWYPNLPYLVGQHVWFNNDVYRCTDEYTEGDDFSLGNYIKLIENVKDIDISTVLNKGDHFLFNMTLWLNNLDNHKSTDFIKFNNDVWINLLDDYVIRTLHPQYRQYYDGTLTNKRLRFKNEIRINSYELSPFDETLVIDSDYIINNDVLKYCWEQPHEFLISKKSVDLSGYRYDPRLHTISDKSIDFYWATVFFFRKTENTKIFFGHLEHILENWDYYRLVYQIDIPLYRNDYAYSIAIHVMNGYHDGDWAHDLPGKMYFTSDRDILIGVNDTSMKFLIEKEKYAGEYTLLKTTGLNVHVMNKFSLARSIREREHV